MARGRFAFGEIIVGHCGCLSWRGTMVPFFLTWTFRCPGTRRTRPSPQYRTSGHTPLRGQSRPRQHWRDPGPGPGGRCARSRRTQPLKPPPRCTGRPPGPEAPAPRQALSDTRHPDRPGLARRAARFLPDHVSSVTRQRTAPAPCGLRHTRPLPSNDGQVHPFDRVVNTLGLPHGTGIACCQVPSAQETNTTRTCSIVPVPRA